MSDRVTGGGPPPASIAASYVGARELRGSVVCPFGTVVAPLEFFAAAVVNRLANAGFAAAKLVDATRRIGSEDRARASAAGVGRVTAVGWSMSGQQPRR